MTDLIYTHISARVPGPDHHFLINAFGWRGMRSRVDARQSHARRRHRGRSDRSGINRAGYVIHSAVHRRGPRSTA